MATVTETGNAKGLQVTSTPGVGGNCPAVRSRTSHMIQISPKSGHLKFHPRRSVTRSSPREASKVLHGPTSSPGVPTGGEMPRLTLRDKKGAPARQPAFIRDLRKALARRNTPLRCMLSMDLGRRERLARWDQRWKERMAALELPTDPTILINYLHANENRSSNAVRAIPAKVHPVEADEKRIEKGKPSYRERCFLTRVTHLRDHRFLTLEFDLAQLLLATFWTRYTRRSSLSDRNTSKNSASGSIIRALRTWIPGKSTMNGRLVKNEMR